MKNILSESREHPSNLSSIIDESLIKLMNDNSDEFISESILASNKYLNKIIEKNSITVTQLKSDTTHSFESFENVVDGINTFVDFLNSINQYRPFSESIRKDFKELQFSLLCILKAVTSAYKKQDYFMLCDLLEYELNDNLSLWKIQILSKIKV